MPTDNYRYYCLDGLGRLHNAQWFYAASDEDAVSLVAAKQPDGKCEIWQERRMVAQLGFVVDDIKNSRVDPRSQQSDPMRDTTQIAFRLTTSKAGRDAR